MPAVLTANPYPNGYDNTQKHQVVFGTLAFSGSYPTNGYPISWGQLTDVLQVVPTPVFVIFQSQDGVNAAAAYQTYVYDYVHNTLRIFVQVTSTGVVEASGTPSADVVVFRAEFVRNVG